MPVKVGKKVGRAVYIHLPAILSPFSCLTKLQIWEWYCAQLWLPEGYEYDMVCIEPKRIRFLKMSHILEAHPHVMTSQIVTWTRSQKHCKVFEGKLNWQIYHRLETMLEPESDYYAYHAAVTAYEESIGALGPFEIHGKTPSGHLNIWIKQLKSKGIDYDDMMEHIRMIRTRHEAKQFRASLGVKE